MYNIIRNRNRIRDADLYGQLQKIKVLPVALHFAQKVMINKVATHDNLIKIGMNVIKNVCVMCESGEEIVQHLFFNCITIQNIWKRCDKWASIVTSHYNATKYHFYWFIHI